jgi:hypothetical protein
VFNGRRDPTQCFLWEMSNSEEEEEEEEKFPHMSNRYHSEN